MSSHPKLLPKLLPRPQSSSDQTSQPGAVKLAEGSERSKQASKAPCCICRDRKIKCDGARPRCSSCAKRNRECRYGSSKDGARMQQHERASQLLELLTILPQNEAATLLDSLRNDRFSNPSDSAIKTSLSPTPMSLMAPRLILSVDIITLGFELGVRFPIAYPTLAPLAAPQLPLDDLFSIRPPFINGIEFEFSTSRSLPQTTSFGSIKKSPEPSAENSSEPLLETRVGVDTETQFSLNFPYFDDRLHSLNISKWSNVAISNSSAAGAISLYLANDHPVLPVFDREPFLKSLLHYDNYHCSSLLVNALLAWACQAFSVIDPDVLQFGKALFEEAELIWRNSGVSNTLTNVAALQLMSMTAATYGLEDKSKMYCKAGADLGRLMGLFDVSDPAKSAVSWASTHPEWLRAASCTAWGTFSWMCIRALHYHDIDILIPPLLPMPGNTLSKSHGVSPPGMDNSIINASCRLFAIIHDMTARYYRPETTGTIAVTGDIAFAESIYRRLLDWSLAIPLDLVRRDDGSHITTLLHIYFHAIITDLFRPFFQTSEAESMKFSTFEAPHADAIGAYHASVEQLKRLLLDYRVKHGNSHNRLSVLWQTAAIYVLNAALRETPGETAPSAESSRSSSPPPLPPPSPSRHSSAASVEEVEFYIRLSLTCLWECAQTFFCFRAMTIGAVGMAMSRRVISRREAGRLAREIWGLAEPHDAAASKVDWLKRAEATASSIPAAADEEAHPTWVLDLNLAVLDIKSARGGNVVRSFKDALLAAASMADSPDEGED